MQSQVGPWNENVGPLSRHILAPVVGGLLALLLTPYLLALVGLWGTCGLDVPVTTQLQAVRTAQNTILVCLGSTAIWYYVRARRTAWTIALRDQLYLDSTELCNYNPDRRELDKSDDSHLEYGPLPDSFMRT